MKLKGQAFKNGTTCEGEAFGVSDAPLDMASIDITGRYPETGWARNRECYETVRILRGVGSLAIRDEEPVLIKAGDVVHVPTGQQFAWEGDMTILMACSPPFNPDQYELSEESHEI